MGYNDALTLAAQRLAQMPPEVVCQACGVRYEGGDFLLRWFNRERSLSGASPTQKILWLHYLTANGSKKEAGRLIAYREAAPALFYEANFYKRAVRPLADCFGARPQKLVEAGEALGGHAAEMGDAAITVHVLPYLPMTFIMWEGSDEFPPEGNILFDQSAKTWFKAEDLAVLASAAVYELMGASKEGNT